MAGMSNSWREGAVRVGSHTIQQWGLNNRPDIQLFFLQLPDGGDPRGSLGWATLTKLWEDGRGKQCARTFVPARSPYASCYRHADLIATLVKLLTRQGATLMRGQSVVPDDRVPGYHDHVAASKFATAAAYDFANTGHRILPTFYHDYNVASMQVNVSPDLAAVNIAAFKKYVAHDYRTPYGDAYEDRLTRHYLRFPRHTTWVGTNKDSTLQAFAFLGKDVCTWRQSSDGQWQGPTSLGNAKGLLTPSLTVVANADGRLQLFALRLDTREVVTKAQDKPNGDFGDGGLWIGLPYVDADAQDGIAAMAGPGGRMDLYVQTRTDIYHLTRPTPDDDFERVPLNVGQG
jgi:hypothetical protein